MANAFPADVLLPLSCTGKDGWGSFSLTLVDTLDALALLGNRTEFEARVWWVVEHLSFDVDETVSLFETTIRALGGLLSAHLLAADPQLRLMEAPYDPHGGLLLLALDLAERLLPALDTPSGIPYGSIHLRDGVSPTESTITCTAAAGASPSSPSSPAPPAPPALHTARVARRRAPPQARSPSSSARSRG